MKILNAREPIENVLKQKNLPESLRHKLELSLEIRKFIKNEMHLKITKNYETFVDIKRPYVTYIVAVAEKWQLKPHLFWYPIVGELPYKGFFTKAGADEEATKFSPDKYDVMVRGVSAYSTLGWFDDPLLSSMIGGEDFELVNLLIHESTHATIYIKSQADFNEQLATFVAGIGTEIFYKNKGDVGLKTLQEIKDENYDDDLFSKFISETNKELKTWYDEHKNLKEEDRQNKFNEIKNKFSKEILPKMRTKNYLNFDKVKLNNAVLLQYNTYVNNLTDFQKLYDHFNHNIDAFLNFCKSLEKDANPRQRLVDYLAAAQSDLPPAVHK